jgi:HSP20 family molecular chaperone IbpA
VDPAHVQAVLQDGVLKIELPKHEELKEHVKPRTMQVRGE